VLTLEPFLKRKKDRKTERQKDRKTERKTERQKERQKDRKTVRQKEGEKYGKPETTFFSCHQHSLFCIKLDFFRLRNSQEFILI
jgi:hypothetical protein